MLVEEMIEMNAVRIERIVNTTKEVLKTTIENSSLLDNPADNANENIARLYNDYMNQYIVEKLRKKLGV